MNFVLGPNKDQILQSKQIIITITVSIFYSASLLNIYKKNNLALTDNYSDAYLWRGRGGGGKDSIINFKSEVIR